MKSVVLLSGGLDSAVSLSQALREGEVRLCLTFDYGQRAGPREINGAAKMAGYYGLKHSIVSLPFLRDVTSTSLVNREAAVPELEEEQLSRREEMDWAARRVWVPNRNGVFINIAASYAESMGCGQIVTGFNAEEARTFPDNSREFILAANQAFYYSTLSKVKVVSYTQMLDKVEIAKLGKRLGTPLEYVWPCYHGQDDICGRCESCRRYLRAVRLAAEGNPVNTIPGAGIRQYED